MTGHDLDLEAIKRGFEHPRNCDVCIGLSPSRDGHDANPPCSGYVWQSVPLLIAEVESLRAKLAAAEQERDHLDRLAADKYHEARRLRAALAAVRNLPHEDWCCGDGCSNPYHRAGCSDCDCWKSDVETAITAATEPDEPGCLGDCGWTHCRPPCPHAEPKRDLLAGYVPTEDTTPEITDAIARSAAAWMNDDPTREQS